MDPWTHLHPLSAPCHLQLTLPISWIILSTIIQFAEVLNILSDQLCGTLLNVTRLPWHTLSWKAFLHTNFSRQKNTSFTSCMLKRQLEAGRGRGRDDRLSVHLHIYGDIYLNRPLKIALPNQYRPWNLTTSSCWVQLKNAVSFVIIDLETCYFGSGSVTIFETGTRALCLLAWGIQFVHRKCAYYFLEIITMKSGMHIVLTWEVGQYASNHFT